MSLKRLLLRTAVVEAISTKNDDDIFPTMAGKNVHDSKITEIDKEAIATLGPIAIVYTDEYSSMPDGGDGITDQDGPECQVRIELAIGKFQPVYQTDEDGNVVSGPDGNPILEGTEYAVFETDAQLEAMLDIFEAQIRFAMHNPLAKSSSRLKKLMKGMRNFTSTRESSDREPVIASRNITFVAHINDDCYHYTGEAMSAQERAAAPYFEGATYLNKLVEDLVASDNDTFKGVLDMLRMEATGKPLSSPPGLRGVEFRAVDRNSPKFDEGQLPSGSDGVTTFSVNTENED